MSAIVELRVVGRAAAILAACVLMANPAAAGHDDRTRSESAYLAANDAAMSQMMKSMAVTPSGNVDRDFVAMMVPHHQGAIDMARAVLEYGTDERLKRLAQEIIVTQQEEITAMRRIADTPIHSTSARNQR